MTANYRNMQASGGRALRNLMTLAASVAAVAGCQDGKFQTATDLQAAKMDTGRQQFGHHYTNMVDNAILHDMSLADIHFIPHSSELSGTGAARLDRMAMLLDTYGGTVHYETTLRDEDLIGARMDHAREYLEVVGCDMTKVEVVAGTSGGRGILARDALEGEDRVTTEAQQGGGSSMIPAGFGGSGQ